MIADDLTAGDEDTAMLLLVIQFTANGTGVLPLVSQKSCWSTSLYC